MVVDEDVRPDESSHVDEVPEDVEANLQQQDGPEKNIQVKDDVEEVVDQPEIEDLVEVDEQDVEDAGQENEQPMEKMQQQHAEEQIEIGEQELERGVEEDVQPELEVTGEGMQPDGITQEDDKQVVEEEEQAPGNGDQGAYEQLEEMQQPHGQKAQQEHVQEDDQNIAMQPAQATTRGAPEEVVDAVKQKVEDLKQNADSSPGLGILKPLQDAASTVMRKLSRPDATVSAVRKLSRQGAPAVARKVSRQASHKQAATTNPDTQEQQGTVKAGKQHQGNILNPDKEQEQGEVPNTDKNGIFKEQSTYRQIQVSILYDQSDGRVLFLEAGKDFVDLLMNFLLLPIGSVMKLLHDSKADVTGLGAVVRLFHSVEKMEQPIMVVDRQVLMEPQFARSKTDDNGPPHAMDPPLAPLLQSGYVKENMTFTITDELEVFPSSTIKSIALFNELQVKSMADLKSLEVAVTTKDVVRLLRGSLTSKSVLNTVFQSRLGSNSSGQDEAGRCDRCEQCCEHCTSCN